MFISRILKALVAPPVLVSREGKPPFASFNKLQFWAHPDLCTAQFEEAMRHCPEDVAVKARAFVQAYFGLVSSPA